MKISLRLRQAALSIALALVAAGTWSPAFAQSMREATPPAPPQTKAAIVEQLKLPSDAQATPIRLDAPDTTAVEKVKRANGASQLKRVQIGLNRDVTGTHAQSGALDWTPVEGGYAARWSITSAGAKALRVGFDIKRSAPSLQLRFAGSARPGTVYGPVTEAQLNGFAGKTYWSPVLEGDTATVELFVESAPSAV